jgi:transcriptional regulator with XRE-family HTH domain
VTKKDDRIALGGRIRAAREYTGFSQEDVAAALRIPRSAVSLIESGERRIDGVELTRLAKLFGCSVGQLTGEQPTSPPADPSIDMVARLAAELSDEDRMEVMRFAEFRSSRRKADNG